jgi:hypothetical protein
MAAAAQYGSLPFEEQIAFFLGKVNMPTAAWTDAWNEDHDRAFVVAGAMRDDMLADFRAAVDKAISQGTTLEEFRRDFDSIVEKYGWEYNGGRNWRSKVIYDTNLRTSYMAGRFAQLQRSKSFLPYWQYVHSDFVTHPRPMHLAWDGLILSADDPWWEEHYPPNGWGCRCTVVPLTRGQLGRTGKPGPDQAPAANYETVTVGEKGPSPRTVEVPAGVDPGFGYTPGKAAWQRAMADQALDEEAAGVGDWKIVTPSDWRSYGRPADVPMDAPSSPLAEVPATVDAAQALLEGVLGADSVVFDVKGVPVLVDAAALAAHVEGDLARAAYFPLLLDVLNDPFEVWVTGEVNDQADDFRVRTRIIKGFELDKSRTLVVVAESSGGYYRSVTIIPTSQLGYLRGLRKGVLVWGG